MLSVFLLVSDARADSVETALADNSVKSELASFEVTEGYEINAFATEELGIANPIVMNWDARGRLWVLCSLVYPQLVPTEPADDKIFILEDTDNDGVADKSTVFVEGLNMPTGFALGDGGVYVGESADIVFLKDENGDDKADSKETIFSGFGTGDTHQNINSFTWSPEVKSCFVRVSTPFPASRLPGGLKSSMNTEFGGCVPDASNYIPFAVWPVRIPGESLLEVGRRIRERQRSFSQRTHPGCSPFGKSCRRIDGWQNSDQGDGRAHRRLTSPCPTTSRAMFSSPVTTGTSLIG